MVRVGRRQSAGKPAPHGPARQPACALRGAKESCASLHVVLLDTGQLLTLHGGERAALPLVHRINLPVTVATLVTTVRSIDPQALLRTASRVMLVRAGATDGAVGDVIGHDFPPFLCWSARRRERIADVAPRVLLPLERSAQEARHPPPS